MTDQPTALETFGLKSTAAAKLAQRMVAKLGPDSADEDWIMAESQMKEVVTFSGELRTAFKEAFVERLKQGDIEMGERRWYAGKVKKHTRTMGAGELLEKLFDAVGGDFDVIKRCLSGGQGVWKKSEVQEAAPDLHDESFTTEPVWELKEGKPRRQKLEPRLTR